MKKAREGQEPWEEQRNMVKWKGEGSETNKYPTMVVTTHTNFCLIGADI